MAGKWDAIGPTFDDDGFLEDDQHKSVFERRLVREVAVLCHVEMDSRMIRAQLPILSTCAHDESRTASLLLSPQDCLISVLLGSMRVHVNTIYMKQFSIVLHGSLYHS